MHLKYVKICTIVKVSIIWYDKQLVNLQLYIYIYIYIPLDQEDVDALTPQWLTISNKYSRNIVPRVYQSILKGVVEL